MKALIFTSLYPNNVWPQQGVFIKERMTHYARLKNCEAKVVAPVPYYPPIKIGSRWKYSQVAHHEMRDGLDVYHPRYFTYFEMGRVEMLRQAGYRYAEMGYVACFEPAMLAAMLVLFALFAQLAMDGAARIDGDFFASFPSRHAARAGILSAWVGSTLVMVVTAFFAVPLGVAPPRTTTSGLRSAAAT